jgi:hypothetical protein
VGEQRTRVGRLAEYFRSRPDCWVDGRMLATIGGCYAWRSRVSDLRRRPFCMEIQNRTRRIETDDGAVVVSEYRFVPKQPDVVSLF